MEKSIAPATIDFSSTSLSSQALDGRTAPLDIAVSLYEHAVPEFVESELERLYASFYSSCSMFRAYGMLNDASTYVATKGPTTLAIFIFKRDKSTVTVLNEQITVEAEEIERFAAYIFAAFKEVSIIVFKALETRFQKFSFPYQKTKFTNDIVLQLPKSPESYLSGIGSSTRQNIRYYQKRIKKDCPSFSYHVTEGSLVDEQQLQEILDLNQARMENKNKACGIDTEEREHISRIVRSCGLVGVATINGKVCAGTICYRVGDDYFLRVLAHDSAYNAYGLGTLCCYLAICECIARGAKRYHFMWGREEYKYRLGGQHQDFDTLTIYRSRLAYGLNGSAILRKLVREYIDQAKFWLLDPKNKDRVLPRCARSAKELLRRNKKALFMRSS